MTYTENGTAVAIADVDIAITDVDSTTLTGATITLTNAQAGDVLAAGALPSGITAVVSGNVVTLSGAASLANYQTAIRAITFASTSENPATVTRSISVVVTDGITPSAAATTLVAINLAPDPVNDAVSGNEGSPISGNVLTNDADLGTTPITSVTVATGPTSGTLTAFNTTTGAFTYTPTGDFNGTDTFTYTVTDANGDTKTATVTITVNAVNDTPTVAAPASIPVTEDVASPVTGISFADVDAGVAAVTVTLSVPSGTLAAVTGGSVTVAGSGSGTLTLTGTVANINSFIAASNVAFTTAPNATVNVTLTATINDQGNTGIDPGLTGTATTEQASTTITLAVTAVDDLPVAAADTISATEDGGAVTGSLAGNDTPSGDGGNVWALGSTLPTKGSVVITATGGYTYTPAANQNGSDTFTYTLTDADGDVSTATVTVNITAVNNAPVLDLDGSGAGTGYAVTYTENGTAVAIADVDIAITDVDSTTLTGATITLTNAQAGDVLAAGALPSGITAVVSGNVVTLSGAASLANYQTAIRAITFASTSENPATVTRSISVVVTDGITPSAAATTLVAINLAPDPVNDAVSGNEGSPIAGNVLTNDTDLGTTPITSVTVATGPTSGTLTAFNTTTGAFTYTPTGDFNGTDTFTYTVTDANGDTKTATVTITVNAVNDTPTVAAPASIPVTEDVASPVTGISFADVDAGAAAVTVTLSVPSGTLAAVTGGSVTVAGSGSGTLTLTGTVANINSFIAASNVAFTTAPNATVNVTLTATINDQGNTGIDPGLTGTATTEQASTTITLAVTAVDDLPVAAADTISATEDGGAVTGSLAGNDTPSGDGGNVWALGSTLPTKGSVVITATGGYTYTPAANQNGSDTFTYTLTDADGDVSTATVTVNITAVDDLPVAAADTISATEDGGAVTGSLAGNDTPSGDGGNVWALGSTLPTKGSVVITATGGYTYTPAANQNGSDTFTYTITDADGDVSTATVTVNITAVDDLPVAAADTISATEDGGAVTGSLAGNDTPSGDGGNVWALGSTLPTKGSVVITATGGYTYTPAANQNGSDTFTYTITDADGDVSTATVTVNITAVDDLPVAAADTISATEDGGAVTGSLAGNDTPSGDGGNVWALGSTLPTKGTVVITATGGYTYTPAANQNGSDTFTYTITDADGDVSTATVTVNITAVDDLPVAAADTISATEDGGAVTGSLAVMTRLRRWR